MSRRYASRATFLGAIFIFVFLLPVSLAATPSSTATLVSLAAAPSTTNALTLSPAAGAPGVSVTVSGANFLPKKTVQLTWDGSTAGMPSIFTNKKGTFQSTFAVPSGALAGTHVVATTQALTSASFSVILSASSPTPTPAPTPAPTTGTSWISPEGTLIQVNSAGPWTTAQIYQMLKANGLNSVIGPTLTVRVQDTYGTYTVAAVQESGGVYSNFNAVMYLLGAGSNMVTTPDAVIGHEFGHVWTLYNLYMTQRNDWTSYLQFRGLVGDTRVDSSYMWSKMEMIAEDYRMVLGSDLAKQEWPTITNYEIPAPSAFPSFRDFFLVTWGGGTSTTP